MQVMQHANLLQDTVNTMSQHRQSLHPGTAIFSLKDLDTILEDATILLAGSISAIYKEVSRRSCEARGSYNDAISSDRVGDYEQQWRCARFYGLKWCFWTVWWVSSCS
jgi:hypothetical protein